MPPQRTATGGRAGDSPDPGITWYWKFLFAGGVAVFLGLMIALAARYDRPAQFLGGALAVIAVSSFVTFYSKCSDIDIRMRTAIAGAVVVTYLIFFSLVVFSPPLQQASRGGYQDTQEQAAKTNVAAAKTKKPTTNETIPSDLFRMFSWVTAAVIGFYFGGRTVEKVADKLKA